MSLGSWIFHGIFNLLPTAFLDLIGPRRLSGSHVSSAHVARVREGGRRSGFSARTATRRALVRRLLRRLPNQTEHAGERYCGSRSQPGFFPAQLRAQSVDTEEIVICKPATIQDARFAPPVPNPASYGSRRIGMRSSAQNACSSECKARGTATDSMECRSIPGMAGPFGYSGQLFQKSHPLARRNWRQQPFVSQRCSATTSI